MNISLISYAFNGGKHPLQLINALPESVSISKFFISRSTYSLFTSSNNALKRFALYDSSFNRYLNSIVSIRCFTLNQNQNIYYSIERASFANTVSEYQGSALFCKHNAMKVSVSLCRFANCTSTCSGASYQRESGTSGGACFFSVSNVIMNSCFFESCVGAALGSAVYVSTPTNHFSNISCMCDVVCGNDITSIHSIYAFEVTTSDIRYLNSTNSVCKNLYGILHIGVYPETFNAKYFSIIMKTGENIAIPLGISLQDSGVGYLEHAYIANGNNNGIISTWLGTYEFNDIVFNPVVPSKAYDPIFVI